MARIAIIIAVLILLAAGGWAVYTKFTTGAWPFMEALGDGSRSGVAVVGPQPDDPFAQYNPDQGIEPNFVDLRPFHITVYQGVRVTRHVELIVSVQVTSAALQPLVYDSRERLQAAFLEELNDYVNLLYEETGDLNLYYIKRRLLHIGNKELGPGTLHDVLIRHVFVRRVG